MSSPAGRRLLFPVCLLAAFVVGALLRLDQVLAQVLLDDEWHLVHQITYYPPTHMVTTFGGADYSIPLALLDWVAMQQFALSEFTLRLPMIVAGLLTVIVLPMGLRGRLEGRVIALFALLLALSPFLISYSRIARPYALTLLAVYLAYGLFERASAGPEIRWKSALGYGVLCGLVGLDPRDHRPDADRADPRPRVDGVARRAHGMAAIDRHGDCGGIDDERSRCCPRCCSIPARSRGSPVSTA